ncbi:10865_t:CDS:2 [Racocetra fulgida]|uniref:10865_t:CDS:1 n=1 Tax=Racocetra fulgida TaxID=60492 RepID=A0A9N9EQ20_9GLOM|nr:10865_t:CDS:2 [Racocetra fulgida]
MTVVDIATVIDSMAPLEQTNASEPSISEESLEWHHFLSTNDECNSRVSKIAGSPPPSCSDTRIMLEENKSPISTPRTIETSALHSVIPKSVTSTNIAWNNFLHTSDITSNVDFESAQDDNEKFDIYSSLSILDSPKLSSKQIIASKRRKRINPDEFSENSNNNEGNLCVQFLFDALNLSVCAAKNDYKNFFAKKNSDYIKENEQFNYNQDIIIGQNVLNRIHNLEVKNACLQLELSFLKQDMKCLMKATKNSSNETPDEPHSSNIQTQTDEFEQVSVTNIEPSIKQDFMESYETNQDPSQTNEQNRFVNEPSQDEVSQDSTNASFSLVNIPTSGDLTHSVSDHVKACTKNIQSSVSLMSPTTNFSNWETLPEMMNSDMCLFDALDDDDDPQKCLEISKD